MATKQSASRNQVTKLEQIPNVGSATAGDFRRLGIAEPRELRGKDAYALYDELCKQTGVRQDPCVIDVFLAAVRFMEGKPAKPWWDYTAERKQELAKRAGR